VKNREWLSAPCALPDEEARSAAHARQGILTKPPGALGRLEELAIHLAALQGSPLPRLDRAQITIFAADHGVTVHGISAFPQSVTAQMVRNFAAGGAAIAVLARELGAHLEVVDVGTVESPGPLPGVRDERIRAGTADFLTDAAMSDAELAAALMAGRLSVERAHAAGAQIYIGGEMGIGNTTAATALACALLGDSPAGLAGPGTGLDRAGVERKAAVIAAALDHHRTHLRDPAEALRRLGGLEIAALTGAYIHCAQRGLPALVDGFITTAAALAAERLRPGAAGWFLYSHASAEPGHVRLLRALDAHPLLNLGLRLGEGSGAAAALPLLQLACTLHSGMATFAEAGVSNRE
jgi:nicotinate-nucleotide--dimethylbenzimidazole phosphoribosyltransferase